MQIQANVLLKASSSDIHFWDFNMICGLFQPELPNEILAADIQNAALAYFYVFILKFFGYIGFVHA